MNRKGFTLVELLAVITILAILVIIALPNVLSLFNNAKKSSFETELKTVYSAAEEKWISDTFSSSGTKSYAHCLSGNCNNELKLNGRDTLEYYIEFDSKGNVVKYFAKDGSYQYSYSGSGLKKNDIADAVLVSNLSDSEKIDITCSGLNITCSPFNNSSSWADIVSSIRNGKTDCMNVGDTKDIDLGSLGTFPVRIANKSTPAACSESDFSKTACGIVLEFTNVVTYRAIDGDGWEASGIRTYLNNDFYNLLPTDLKSAVANTYVVSSSYTPGGRLYYRTTDKIYLLDSYELHDAYTVSYTRCLDFYVGKALRDIRKSDDYWVRDTENYSGPTGNVVSIMMSNGSPYVLQSASQPCGVSPAFRIE